MKALAATLACLFLVTICAPAGSQERPVIVQPKVHVHTGVVESVEPAAGPEAFGTTLLLRFWTAKGDAEVLAIQVRCATPEFSAFVSRTSDEGADHLQIEGTVHLLRDGQILVLFDARVSSRAKGPDQGFQAKGSVTLRQGVPKALVSTGDLSLNARFTFDAEE